MRKIFWLFPLCVLLAVCPLAVAAPVISANGVVNNASFAPGVNALAPGTLAAIFGTGLNDGSRIAASSFVNGRLVTTLGGASVTFNGIPAPMFSSFPTQLNVQIPLELAGATSAQVVVTVAGEQSAPATVSIASTSPGIFTVGPRQGAILIANTSIFAAPPGNIPGVQSRPANPGEFITIFSTGLGAVNNPPASGAPASGQTTVTATQVTIGGVQANVSFSGMSPGFVALYQVNVQVPPGVGGIVSVVMSIGGRQSNIASIAVSGNGSSGQSFCSGFSLNGTATSLTGTIPASCLAVLQGGGGLTGGVTGSLTGAPSASGTQTIYTGNMTGNGAGRCATGSTSNWTANIFLTITVNPVVTSLSDNGGILSGNYTASGSLNFCGSTQNLGGIAATNLVSGSVQVGGATTVNIGGPSGLPPLVLRGNEQGIAGPLSGAAVTSLIALNNSGAGSLSITATGATSGNQTVFTGSGSGSGTVQQCPGGPGTWTANVSSFTATVVPTISSLATGGGTVIGTWSMSISGTVCGFNRNRGVTGLVSGAVSPGGSLTLTLAINIDDDGNGDRVFVTGTATSIGATVTGAQLFDDPTATGSIVVTATGVSSSTQTVYTGGGTGSGTVSCREFTGSNTIGNWSITITTTITVSPPVPSLASSGGNLSGAVTSTFSGTICGMSVTDEETDDVIGIVSPGGAVTLLL